MTIFCEFLFSALIFMMAAPDAAAGESNKAVWIALGVVLMGLLAMGTSLYAAIVAKKKKQTKNK